MSRITVPVMRVAWPRLKETSRPKLAATFKKVSFPPCEKFASLSLSKSRDDRVTVI